MKNVYLFFFLISQSFCFSQIGIGTTQPTAMLDINGNMRIRNVAAINRETAARDSILTSNIIGNSNRVSSKTLIYSHKKTYVKGLFATASDQNLTLTSSRAKIPFNAKEIDTNNDFNTVTNTFTAPKSGLYAMGVQIKSTAAVGVTTDFGVQIVKNGSNVLAKNSFANIGIDVTVVLITITVNVTQPVRYTKTTAYLNAGDTITFETYSALLNVSLFGNSDENHFYIYEVQ